MRALIMLIALSLASPVVMPASEFDWITRDFARQSGARQVHIPFFGLARLAVSVAHPAGVSALKLAVFESPNGVSGDFSRIADTTLGSGWKPIVRVRDQSGDISNIYVQPDGKYLKLIIATLDKSNAVFVQLRIMPEQLIKFVDEHKRHYHA
jgi:hypothetical protein